MPSVFPVRALAIFPVAQIVYFLQFFEDVVPFGSLYQRLKGCIPDLSPFRRQFGHLFLVGVLVFEQCGIHVRFGPGFTRRLVFVSAVDQSFHVRLVPGVHSHVIIFQFGFGLVKLRVALRHEVRVAVPGHALGLMQLGNDFRPFLNSPYFRHGLVVGVHLSTYDVQFLAGYDAVLKGRVHGCAQFVAQAPGGAHHVVLQPLHADGHRRHGGVIEGVLAQQRKPVFRALIEGRVDPVDQLRAHALSQAFELFNVLFRQLRPGDHRRGQLPRKGAAGLLVFRGGLIQRRLVRVHGSIRAGEFLVYGIHVGEQRVRVQVHFAELIFKSPLLQFSQCLGQGRHAHGSQYECGNVGVRHSERPQLGESACAYSQHRARHSQRFKGSHQSVQENGVHVVDLVQQVAKECRAPAHVHGHGFPDPSLRFLPLACQDFQIARDAAHQDVAFPLGVSFAVPVYGVIYAEYASVLHRRQHGLGVGKRAGGEYGRQYFVLLLLVRQLLYGRVQVGENLYEALQVSVLVVGVKSEFLQPFVSRRTGLVQSFKGFRHFVVGYAQLFHGRRRLFGGGDQADHHVPHGGSGVAARSAYLGQYRQHGEKLLVAVRELRRRAQPQEGIAHFAYVCGHQVAAPRPLVYELPAVGKCRSRGRQHFGQHVNRIGQLQSARLGDQHGAGYALQYFLVVPARVGRLGHGIGHVVRVEYCGLGPLLGVLFQLAHHLVELAAAVLLVQHAPGLQHAVFVLPVYLQRVRSELPQAIRQVGQLHPEVVQVANHLEECTVRPSSYDDLRSALMLRHALRRLP